MNDILRARAARDPRAGPGRHAFARRFGAHTPARERESVGGRGRRRAGRAQPVLRRPAAGAGRRRSPRTTDAPRTASSSRAAATRRSTCWCGRSAAPARTASSFARRASACTVSPPRCRARASSTVPLAADFRLDAEALIRRLDARGESRVPVLAEQPDGQCARCRGRRARAGCARRARDRRDRRGLCRVLAGPRLPRLPGAPSRPRDPAHALQGAWTRRAPAAVSAIAAPATDRVAGAHHAALRPARPHGRRRRSLPSTRSASRARARASAHSSTSASACARRSQSSTASGESGRARPTSCWWSSRTPRARWRRPRDRGLLLRDFSRQPGLAGCLRITIGSREENDRLLAALGPA